MIGKGDSLRSDCYQNMMTCNLDNQTRREWKNETNQVPRVTRGGLQGSSSIGIQSSPPSHAEQISGFIKISTRGSVQKVVREHYLRDDIPCGIKACRVCTNPDNSILLEPSPKQNPSYPDPHIIIPDTNILLHHLDVLERPVFTDAVILQTVLDEVRNRNAKHYDRIRDMILQTPRDSLSC